MYKIEVNTSDTTLQNIKNTIEKYINISNPIKKQFIDKGVVLIFDISVLDNIIALTKKVSRVTFNVGYSVLDNNIVYQSGELTIKDGVIISIWEPLEYSKSAIEFAYEIDKEYILNKSI